MQARYHNTDGSISVGVIMGYGERWRVNGYGGGLTRTVQVRFNDTDETAWGHERVETLYVDEPWLELNVLDGSMVSTLA